MEIFSQRLRYLREKNGFSQKDMAEKLGISQPYYGRFEKGSGEPNIKTLITLSKTLNESTDFMLGLIHWEISFNELYSDFYNYKKIYDVNLRSYNKTLEVISKVKDIIELETRLNFLSKKEEEIADAKVKFESQLNKIIDYLHEVPGTTDNIKQKSYWIERVDSNKL